MTNGKTQEIQENSQIIEIGETNNLVLTQNGVVVGFVTVKRYYDDTVEFLGRTVNVIDSKNGIYSHHGFAGGCSITTNDVQEIATPENFYDAMTKAAK